MRTISFKKTQSVISTVVIVIVLLLTSGCSFGRHAIAALISTDHFIQSQDDPRVLFESGSEDYAKKVVSFLPSTIQQVEEKQYLPFAEPVRVYICASRKCFKKYWLLRKICGYFPVPVVHQVYDIRQFLLHDRF